MENTSKTERLNRRDRAYFRRRQQNRVFEIIATMFAEEAERGAISKKKLADILERDPSQITRWLSAPSNLELDTISDILLAMGVEMEYQAVRLKDRATPNYVHPVVASCVTERAHVVVSPKDQPVADDANDASTNTAIESIRVELVPG